MEKLRVAVLMGGRSAERAVSLSSGRQVLAALDREKYDAFCVDAATIGALHQAETPPLPGPSTAPGEPPAAAIAQDAFSTSLTPACATLLGSHRPDVVLICLHGRFGEDGTIQGLLELLGIPYTGSGVLASALAMNKVMSKTLFRAQGIPTPEAVVLRGRREADDFLKGAAAGRDPFPWGGLPAIVKPNEQGSTIGVTIVRAADELPTALDTALAYDETILIERYIQGTEITAAVLGNETPEVLPLIEIVPSTGFYDYERKYTPGATEEIVPARIAPEEARIARELAIAAHRALGCRGLSRVDMMVADGVVWVLELNTIPGMTPTSLLPRAAGAAGIPFSELLDRLIALALEGRRECAGCAA